ncbi:MAG: HEPN domain-containing protein [Deltaproteobacteria bacterium]|nr:HEPN domain-containing protein [Deltaproteobacteria bacterium]
MEAHKDALVVHRLLRAEEHLQASRELYAKGYYLDSVSRSYYSVLSAARAILATIGMDSAKHSGVISIFDKFFVKEGKLSVDASRIFHELKDYREKADYADYPEITKEIANNEILRAEKFLKEAMQYVESNQASGER